MLAAVIMEFVPTASLEGPQDSLMLPPPPQPHPVIPHEDRKKMLDEYADSCQGLIKEFSWKKYYTRDTITPEGEKVSRLNEAAAAFNVDLTSPFMKFLSPRTESAQKMLAASTNITPALQAVMQDSIIPGNQRNSLNMFH